MLSHILNCLFVRVKNNERNRPLLHREDYCRVLEQMPTLAKYGREMSNVEVQALSSDQRERVKDLQKEAAELNGNHHKIK